MDTFSKNRRDSNRREEIMPTVTAIATIEQTIMIALINRSAAIERLLVTILNSVLFERVSEGM
jgi:hypothetical protein